MGSLQKASLHDRVCRLGGECHAHLGIFTALFRISRHKRFYADTLSLQNSDKRDWFTCAGRNEEAPETGDSGLLRVADGGTSDGGKPIPRAFNVVARTLFPECAYARVGCVTGLVDRQD